MRHELGPPNLQNREAFEQRLHRAITGLSSNRGIHCLAHLHLDGLEQLVHLGAEEPAQALLHDVVLHISQRLRSRDTLARLNHYNLGLLLEHCPLDRARDLLWSLSLSVARYTVTWQQVSYHTHLNVGLVALDASDISILQSLSHAEVACHIARQTLAGGVYVYEQANLTHPRVSAQATAISLQPLQALNPQHPPHRRLCLDGMSELPPPETLLKTVVEAFPQVTTPLLLPISGQFLDNIPHLHLPCPLYFEVPWQQRDGLDADQWEQVVISGFSGSLEDFRALRARPPWGLMLSLSPSDLYGGGLNTLLAGLVAALQELSCVVILDGLHDEQSLQAAQALGADLVGGHIIGSLWHGRVQSNT